MRHPLGAVLEDRLELIGWDLLGDDQEVLAFVPRRTRHARLRLLLRARASAIHGYCTFIHIEHSPTRFSSEHRQLTYPMPAWHRGDVIADDFDVTLPAHFRAGAYQVFWGVGLLPCEDDKRMHVTSGPSDGRDRVPGGSLEVR